MSKKDIYEAEYLEFSNTLEDLERAYRMQKEEKFWELMEELEEFGEKLEDASWSKPRRSTKIDTGGETGE